VNIRCVSSEANSLERGKRHVDFDLLIKNGTIVDGTGAPGHAADLGIVDGHIAAIGSLDEADAETVVDAAGKVVAPGFIDVHVHSEAAILGGRHPYGSVLQGVTTHLIGADGFGWAPLPPEQAQELWETTAITISTDAPGLSLDWSTIEDFLSIFPGSTPVNVGFQVPHLAVRAGAMGMAARTATDDELEVMKATSREWMEAGAVGLCLGLDYQPSSAADLHELVELSKVVREYGGIYAAHVRYIDFGSEGAWRETIEIGEQADIAVHISHEEVNDVTATLLDEAAQRCDLTFESYMYPAGCTHLSYLLPTWAKSGGPRGLRERLKDPSVRQQLRNHVEQSPMTRADTGAKAIFVATPSGRYIGMSIVEAAEVESESQGEFVIRVLQEEYPAAMLVYHRAVTPEDHREIVQRTIQHPVMLVASDGFYAGQSSHPRGYGCFARVLRLCVRELEAISIEEAIYKMSGFPAARFGIRDRGLLKEGLAADVVIFDPATVADQATWDKPFREPVGIDRVIVNGQTVVIDGQPTGLLPGQLVRRGS
jgi:N-acyl-D-amino-acid deacylase